MSNKTNTTNNDINLVKYIMSDQYIQDMEEDEIWKTEQMEILRKEVKEYNT